MLHGGNKTFQHEENSAHYSICCVVIANGKKTNFRVLYSDNEARNFSNRILWTTACILHMV